MDNVKLITVIVPVYNREEYIDKCVESILAQTYQNIQIVLVDDGSTDNSGIICDMFEKKYKNIVTIHKKNGGLVSARKAGLELAKGEYVGFVDADDWIENNMYEVMLNHAQHTNTPIVNVAFAEIRGDKKYNRDQFNKRVVHIDSVETKKKYIKDFVLNQELKEWVAYSLCTKLFNRELIKRNYANVPDYCQFGEDLLCYLSLVLEANAISLVPEVLYNYRIIHNSISNKKTESYLRKEVLLSNEIYQILEQYNDDKQFMKEVDGYIGWRMLHAVDDSMAEHKIARYEYKNIDQLRGTKIVIDGAGIAGKDYYTQLSRYRDIDIVAWVDSNWMNVSLSYTNVVAPEKVLDIKYDFILIAVENQSICAEIKEKLIAMGVETQRIIWEIPLRVR